MFHMNRRQGHGRIQVLQTRAVALLILAFLAIEMDETPGPCERRYTLATPNPEHSKEWEEITEQTQELFTGSRDSAKPYVWARNLTLRIIILEVPDGEGGCQR